MNSFLDDLSAKLQGKVDPDRSSEILQELQSHLRESQQAARELGLDQDAAERVAIEAMGSVDLLAEDLIRRETGLETGPAWKFAALPAILLVLAETTALFLSMRTQYLGYYWVTEWLHYAVLLTLAWALWRARRWLIGPMATALLAASLVGTLIFTFVPPDITQGQPKEAVMQAYNRESTALQAKIDTATEALAGAPPKVSNGFEAPYAYDAESRMKLTYLPVSIRIGSNPAYLLQTYPTKQEAASIWRQQGDGYLSYLHAEAQRVKESRQTLSTGQSPVHLKPLLIPMLAVNFSYQICIFTTLNAAALLLLSRRRTRKATAKPLMQ